jgi:hypothetical protein
MQSEGMPGASLAITLKFNIDVYRWDLLQPERLDENW